MATITWTNGNATGLWNDAGNWDAGVPTGADDAVLDATSTAACTCDVAIDVLSLTVAAGYSGKLDFADSAFSHLIGTGGALFVGSGEVDCGNSTITCSGNWDNDSQGTWTPGTSTVVMDTNATTMSVQQDRPFYDLTISGNVTINGSLCDIRHTFTIDIGKTATIGSASPRLVFADFDKSLVLNGTLLIPAGEVFGHIQNGQTRTIVIGPSGKITGAGQVNMRDVVITNNNAGTSWDVATTLCRASCTIGVGIYGGSWTCNSQHGTRTLTIGNGAGETVEFSNPVTFDQDASVGTYTIDAATHNSKLIFNGNVTISKSGGGTGVVAWSESNAADAITFSGTTTINDSAVVGTLGDTIVADGASVALASDIETDNLTVAQNAVITGAFLFDVGGNFLVNGASGNTVTWTDADLSVSGTAVASFTTVTNSDASIAGGTEINATNNCTDSGGNTNWDFGVAASILPQMTSAYLRTNA